MLYTRAGYRESMRRMLGIRTPRYAGVQGASEGEVPQWTPEPGNPELNDWLAHACDIVNQQAGIGADKKIRTLSVAAQTGTGPFSIDLSAVYGYPERSIIGIRRAWWDNGSGPVPLSAKYLSGEDRQQDQYASNPVSTPLWFAIEGYTLFLSPSPSGAGTLSFMSSTGLLAPQTDEESFSGLPFSYDVGIVTIAVVEYGKSDAADAEMAARSRAFTDDAAAALQRIIAWFNGGSNDQAEASLIFDASSFRRNSRRR